MKKGTIRVVVSMDDIDGADKSAGNGPLARAIKRRLDTREVVVWWTRCKINGKTYEVPLTASAQDRQFTATGTIKPFEFQLSNTPAADVKQTFLGR